MPIKDLPFQFANPSDLRHFVIFADAKPTLEIEGAGGNGTKNVQVH